MYQAMGINVYFAPLADRDLRATCDNNADAIRAADMLNKARILNDVKRKYTAASRLIAEVENIPGFAWVEIKYTA